MAWIDGFRGSVVLVTGASSGIGRATALAFAAAGAKVVLVARRSAQLHELARQIEEQGGSALPIRADVGHREEVVACFREARERYGKIDVVVSNAGILISGSVAELDASHLEGMLRVNLIGSLFVLQEAVRAMRADGGGSIVCVGSLAGRRGIAPLGGYCASKFALVGLVEALRMELIDEPIHISLVLPGVIETPMAELVTHDPEFADVWPKALNMPPSWVVWAIFAAARFHLVEISVPPGAATLEKLAALAPGISDRLAQWASATLRWVAGALPSS
jgi:NAD(P)-dependent dehydrogenase (short-subunit alcohol dehydrogenase family)